MMHLRKPLLLKVPAIASLARVNESSIPHLLGSIQCFSSTSVQLCEKRIQLFRLCQVSQKTVVKMT